MTRRIPLHALALAAAALAPPAAAEPQVSWSAVGQAAGSWANRTEPGAGRWDAFAGYQLEGTAEDVSDSGITYGATAKVGSGDYEESGQRPGNNAKLTVNEAYLFAVTAYGRFRLGDEDGAADRAVDVLPTLVGGQMSGFWTEAAAVAPPAGYLGRDSDDATKIFYETPDALPVTLGVSYAPKRKSLVEDIEDPSDIAPEDDFLELALGYRGEAGPWTYELGLAWNRAEAGRPGLKDTEAVTLAGLATYGGFSVGAAWFDNGRSGRAKGAPGGDTGGLTVQGTYENGPYGLTLFWHGSEVERVVDYEARGLGLSWRVAEAVTLGADLVHWKAKEPAGRSDGLVALGVVEVSF
ncbi:MAG TPA: porin [Azospirillaceae bacterium]|nr:porin [Azospirillaceae bacterium]